MKTPKKTPPTTIRKTIYAATCTDCRWRLPPFLHSLSLASNHARKHHHTVNTSKYVLRTIRGRR